MKIDNLIGTSLKELNEELNQPRTSKKRISEILSSLDFENQRNDLNNLSEHFLFRKYLSNSLTNRTNLLVLKLLIDKITPDHYSLLQYYLYRFKKVNKKKIEFVLDFILRSPPSTFKSLILSLTNNYHIRKNSNHMKMIFNFYKENKDLLNLTPIFESRLLENFIVSLKEKNDFRWLYNHALKSINLHKDNRLSGYYINLIPLFFMNDISRKYLSEDLVFKKSLMKLLQEKGVKDQVLNNPPKFFYRLYNIHGCKTFCKILGIKSNTVLDSKKFEKIPKGIKRKIERNRLHQYRINKYLDLIK